MSVKIRLRSGLEWCVSDVTYAALPEDALPDTAEVTYVPGEPPRPCTMRLAPLGDWADDERGG